MPRVIPRGAERTRKIRVRMEKKLRRTFLPSGSVAVQRARSIARNVLVLFHGTCLAHARLWRRGEDAAPRPAEPVGMWREMMKERKDPTRRIDRKDPDRGAKRPQKDEERPERSDREAGAGRPVQLDEGRR